MTPDATPVTKTDLAALEASLCAAIAAAAKALALQIATSNEELRREMRTTRTDSRSANNFLRRFNAASRIPRHVFLDAHREQIKTLKEHDTDHARRIRSLEAHAGWIQ